MWQFNENTWVHPYLNAGVVFDGLNLAAPEGGWLGWTINPDIVKETSLKGFGAGADGGMTSLVRVPASRAACAWPWPGSSIVVSYQRG